MASKDISGTEATSAPAKVLRLAISVIATTRMVVIAILIK